MEKVIIFYCKDCGGWLFICRKTEQVIKDSQNQIIKCLAGGHKMEEVELDTFKIKVGCCKCER